MGTTDSVRARVRCCSSVRFLRSATDSQGAIISAVSACLITLNRISWDSVENQRPQRLLHHAAL